MRNQLNKLFNEEQMSSSQCELIDYGVTDDEISESIIKFGEVINE